MSIKLGASISSFRQQHPRLLLGSVCGWLLLGLFMISRPGDLPAAPGLRYLQYDYPPGSLSGGEALVVPTELAFGPKNLTAAVARSEQLWKTHLNKRKRYVEGKGGYSEIRMFSDKAWVGYGQKWTLWCVMIILPDVLS